MSVLPVELPRARARGHEFRAMLALGAPLVLANLAQTGLTTADVILIGRLGPETLAAGALGTNLYFALSFLGIGIVSATSPLMAEERGRCRHSVRDVRRTVRQGLWSAAVVAIPIWLLLWHGEALLLALGEAPDLAARAGPYLRALEWGLLPFLGFAVLRFFVSALERPFWALAIGVAAIPVNVGLALLLIHGGFGIPALGLVGAGAATSLTSCAAFTALATVTLTDRRFRRFHLFGRIWRPDWPRFLRLWRLGLPIAGTLAFEVMLFNAAALAMGILGAVPLAAHAIAIQVAALSFMVPLGIGQAATVRVGLAVGARDPDGVSRAGRTALALAVAFMASVALVLIAIPRPIIGLFVDARDPANALVVALAANLLAYAALFQIADGVQAVGAGLLRGLQDTRVPMLYAGLGYWGIGAPLGLALGFAGGLGGRGIWIGLATGLIAVACLMMVRWTGRGRLGITPATRSQT